MAGDSLRDAFRTELAAVIAAASPSIAWTVRDTLNTAEQPAPPIAGGASSSAGYFEIEFPGGAEGPFSFGSPGNNLHRETGQVTIRAVTRLRAGTTVRDLAETYLAQIRAAFRMRRFAAGARTVRITSTAPMGGGFDEGGMWVETIALAYEIYNVG